MKKWYPWHWCPVDQRDLSVRSRLLAREFLWRASDSGGVAIYPTDPILRFSLNKTWCLKEGAWD